MEAFHSHKFVAILVLLSISYLAIDAQKPKPTKKPTTPKVTTPKPTKPPTPPAEGKDYYVTLKILGQECSPELSNVASPKFQELRGKLYDATLQMYANYDYYQDLLALSFECTEGGILAHFAIRFTKKAKGHMNIFSQAVQAGKIGELEIQPSYIEVTDLDQNLLVGGAPAGACMGGCPQTCSPACDASCCGGDPANEQTIYVPVPMAQPMPPPPPPAPAGCAVGCPATCAPTCTPTCCFVQKRWLAKKAKAQVKSKANPINRIYRPQF